MPTRFIFKQRSDQLYSMKSVYHVMYDSQDREWKVKREGNQKASATGNSKQDAIEKARNLAKNNKPSQVYVHYKSTDTQLAPIQREFSYPAGKV